MVISSWLALPEIPKSSTSKCRSGASVIKEAICTIEFPHSSHSHDLTKKTKEKTKTSWKKYKENVFKRICIVDNPRRVAKWSDCLFCASPASELPSVFFCQQYLSAIRLQSLNRQSPIYQLQFKKARLHLQLQIWSRALLPWKMSFQIWRPLKIFHNNNVFQWWSKDTTIWWYFTVLKGAFLLSIDYAATYILLGWYFCTLC